MYRESEEESADTNSSENTKPLTPSSSQSSNSTGSVPPLQPSSGGRFSAIRKNMNINKTIEDIKKKNLATGKKN